MRYVPVVLVLALLWPTQACDKRVPNEPDLAGDLSLSRDPGAATLTAVASSPTQIDVSWQGDGGQITGYQLFQLLTSGTLSLLATTKPAVTAFSHGGLTPATEYCYQVRSYRTTGRTTTYSAYSSVACAKTLEPPTPPEPALAAPTGVDVVLYRNEYWVNANGASVQVRWIDNSTNEDGFQVELSNGPAGPWTDAAWATGPNVTTFGYSAQREKTTCYRVVATSQSLGPSNPSTADCVTPPALVTNVVAKAGSVGPSVDLSWSDNSSVEDGYAIVRSDGVTSSTIGTVPPNATTYHDATALADITYSYRVLAVKEGIYSDDSNVASIVLATSVPAAPAGPYSETGLDDYGWLHLTVFWADNSANEEGFRVEASADALTGWVTEATFAANTTVYDQKVSPFIVPYIGGCYRIVAYNSKGDSPPSNVTCAEWGVPPSNLAATALDEHSIELTWRDNAQFERRYAVLRSTVAGGESEIVAELPPNSTRYVDTGLESGKEYWYTVLNEYDDPVYDCSNCSDWVSATTLPLPQGAQPSTILINPRTTPMRIRGRTLPLRPRRTITLQSSRPTHRR